MQVATCRLSPDACRLNIAADLLQQQTFIQKITIVGSFEAISGR